jgi:peptidoglycan/LPS O-acetylase OafA/YrhL
VLAPAILLTILLDTIGSQINKDFYRSYSAAGQYIARFIVNILGLQGWRGHRIQFGTNSPLWLIGYEMFFYITYGLIFSKLAKTELNARSRVIWGGALLIVIAAGMEMASYFLMWLLGVLAYKLRRNYRLGGHILSGLILYIATIILDPGYWQDLIFSLGVAVFFISPDGNGYGVTFNEFFANFSYSLYAIHLPLIFFSFSVFWNDQLSLLFFASAITALIVVASFIFSLPFEKKRYVLRAYFKSIHMRLSQGVKS